MSKPFSATIPWRPAKSPHRTDCRTLRFKYSKSGLRATTKVKKGRP